MVRSTWTCGRSPRRRSPTWLIAHLIASGAPNPDIATRLFLSRRTVETHVSHILAKLDANSRVDIARTVFAR
jgi:DNA-binding NarL/FixJ family response regulator